MRGTSFLVFLVCVLSFYGACNAGFVETVYTASLSINQAVPSPNDPQPNAGTAICVYNRNTEPKTLDCEVQQSVTTITGASIQLGERGLSGPFAYNFTVTLGTSFRQIFELQELENYSLDQQIQDFLNGRWYISIFSEDYPLGILRGQLEHADRFYSRLNVQNTIPRATGTSARGIAVGTYSAGNPNRQLALDLVHSVRNPATNGLQIRFGAPGVVGPLIYAFKQPTSPVYAQFDYSINEENEFYAGLQYLNLASATNPSGEIRGQLVTIDYIYELAFTSRLSGNNEETDSTRRGSALVSYDCVTRTMEYLVMHNVPNARGAFAGSGSEDQGASILFQLDNYISPIYGSVVLSPEEEIILYSRIMYFSVTSDSFPEGEIRGQITVDHDFWAYLSGTNVVSPVTTSAVGSATFTLTGQDNRFLNYAIFHSVAEPLEAYVMVGYEGENGVIDRTLRSVFSPIRGEDIQLDDDELEALVTDALYISITSAEYPVTGEIRGQIKRVNPCRASHDNTLTIGSNNSPNQTDSGVITGTVPLSSNDAVETIAISFALIFGFVLAVLF